MAEPERNKYGAVMPNRVRDTMDRASLAMGYLDLTRCPGGRITVKGYVCAHCGIDYSAQGEDDTDNPVFCGQPVDDDGLTPFNAAVARRIMMDGEPTE